MNKFSSLIGEKKLLKN